MVKIKKKSSSTVSTLIVTKKLILTTYEKDAINKINRGNYYLQSK